MKFCHRLVFSVNAILLLLLIGSVNSTRIEFDGRAYSNIVVAVSPDVPKTQANVIIQNIKVFRLI